jgi:hypothetical protein
MSEEEFAGVVDHVLEDLVDKIEVGVHGLMQSCQSSLP